MKEGERMKMKMKRERGKEKRGSRRMRRRRRKREEERKLGRSLTLFFCIGVCVQFVVVSLSPCLIVGSFIIS